MNSRAIGVFDSGVGGLTVVRGIRQVLPKESIVYIGDTARVPYGTRSEETIKAFALEVVEKLLDQDVKALVIACNTITAVATKEIKERVGEEIPVVGVIEPTSRAAVERSSRKRIGVVATPATIRSKAYVQAVEKIDATCEVRGKDAPLFVPIIEEQMHDHPVVELMIDEYLSDMKGAVDSVILGCTHYPMIKKKIQAYFGPNVSVVDSALATAKELKRVLKERELLAQGSRPTQVFFTSDNPEKSYEIARMFLGEDLELERVEL